MDDIELKGKKYFMLSDYGNLCVPVSLINKIVEECFIVSTTWKDGANMVDKVKPLTGFNVINVADIKAAIVQQKLENA
jgi:hypothetical protein